MLRITRARLVVLELGLIEWQFVKESALSHIRGKMQCTKADELSDKDSNSQYSQHLS